MNSFAICRERFQKKKKRQRQWKREEIKWVGGVWRDSDERNIQKNAK